MKELSDLLLEPQREVGGVADHAEQVRRVVLFVLFGPDAADQLGRPHGSGGGRGFSETRTDWSLQLEFYSPVELRFEQSQLASDLYRVEGHEVEGVHLPRPA